MLKIILNEITVPILTVWKWSEKDYEKSLRFCLKDVNVEFYLSPDKFSLKRGLRDRETFLNGKIILKIKNPSEDILNGLNNPSNISDSLKTTENIYELYKQVFQQVIFFCRWYGKINYLFDGHGMSLHNLFYDDISGKTHVCWSLNGSDIQEFQPKIKKSRKISPIFKAKNILTKEKWKKINKCASCNEIISSEIKELIKIKGEANWGRRRIPIVESIALMEVILTNKVRLFLQKKGQSKTKIDDIEKEVGLSVLINLFLPLIFTKSEFKKYKKHIDIINALRKIRNDIMHRNISEELIDENAVKKGIDSLITIANILDKKL